MSSFNIPSFEIESIESVSEFMYKERLTVSRLIIRAIEKGLEEHLLEIPVMKLCLFDMPITLIVINRERFTESLQKCLTYFEEAEEYEQCAYIVNLLKDERLN